MKAKVNAVMFAIMFVLVANSGCFYPKAERAPGELVSEVNYEIINETTVVDAKNSSRQWLYVDCEYWAGCFMRCDGDPNQCKQLAKDSKFSILSVFKSMFE